MHIEDYVVEVQSLTHGDWIEDRRFAPKYKWRAKRLHSLLNLFGLFQRTRPVIETSMMAIVAKASALQHARRILRERKPRSVQIVRSWREGAQLNRIVVWQNGNWLE